MDEGVTANLASKASKISFCESSQAVLPVEERLDDCDRATLLALFNEHHRQLSEKRQRLRDYAERAIGFILLLTGWVAIGASGLTSSLGYVIIAFVIFIAFAASYGIWVEYSIYMTIARIMKEINSALGLFEDGRFGALGSIYPKEWITYGRKNRFGIIIYHCLAIWTAALVCIIGVCIKITI